MTIREKMLIALLAGLFCGLWTRSAVEAQSSQSVFGRDSVTGLAVPIQTNGTNALKAFFK